MCSRRHILSHPHSALPTHDNGKLLVRDQMIFAFHVGFQITAPTYGAGLVRHFIHACKNTGLAGKIVNPGKNLIAKSGFPTLKMVFYKKSRKYAHSYPLPTYISPLNNEQTAIASSKLKVQSSKLKVQSSKFKSSKVQSSKRFIRLNPGFRCRNSPTSPGLPPFSREVNFRVRDFSQTPIHSLSPVISSAIHRHPHSPRSSEKIIHSSKIPSIG